jgi:hypothetical protein
LSAAGYEKYDFAMTTQHVGGSEISEAELEREYELYAELLDRWPADWL